MPAPGRNDPCPCGSGKKYKKCCARTEQEQVRESAARINSVERAIEWLIRRHPQAMREAIMEDFLAGLSDPRRRPLSSLPPGLQDMVMVNANEWLLAEGEMVVHGERRKASEFVLGAGGALLEVADRDWIAALAASPLGLWEVQEARPGEGLWLKDLLDPATEACWVVERSASRSLETWDLLGARRISTAARFVLSGCVYPIDRRELPELRAEIARSRRSRAVKGDPANAAAALSLILRERWLARLTLPPVVPSLVDKSTGKPLLLVTDHYQVKDWGRLADALAREPDVDGDHRQGWTRFEELAEDERRLLLALNVKRNNHLEAFTRTRLLADEGREWLERLAGDSVAFLRREITDPLAALAREPDGAVPRSLPPSAVPMTTELSQAVHEQLYRDWADEPIPCLGNKTPREAARTKAGREQVIDLLKTYEQGELKRAKEENRDPASLAFLWRSVGLEPSSPAR